MTGAREQHQGLANITARPFPVVLFGCVLSLGLQADNAERAACTQAARSFG